MMNSSRVGDELSIRLQKLHSFYTNQAHIWDIGCDHGLLGSSFRPYPVDSIHLVDPSKPVIDKLLKNNIDSYITKPKVFITHATGQSLTIPERNNLIFIAGMGGKEIGEIITHLLPQLDNTSKIVISPHRKILELRARLHELNLGLDDELVLQEGGQYYQILSLIPGSVGPKVPLYGEKLWDSEVGELYRAHQLKNFATHQDPISKGYWNFLKLRNSANLT